MGMPPYLTLCFWTALACLLKPLQSPEAQRLVVQSLRRRAVGGSFWLMRWVVEISWPDCLPAREYGLAASAEVKHVPTL